MKYVDIQTVLSHRTNLIIEIISNMKKFTAVIFLLLLIAQPAQADFNDGVMAYLMGEYETAYNTMRSLAETADHSYAQYYLGMMYLNGQGVDQNYEEAGKWFRKAAEQGIPQAQYKLGYLYNQGQGLPKDLEYAYAWYRVGATYNHQKSINSIEAVRAKLSGEELKEAEILSQDFINQFGPKESDETTKPRVIENE